MGYMCKCSSFNDRLSIHRDRSRSKKQSRRNSSTMLPTMSRLEPGKRDIILLNLDVKVFSYFFPPHSSLGNVSKQICYLTWLLLLLLKIFNDFGGRPKLSS